MAGTTVPALARVASKWARRAGSAGQEYEEGVRATTKSWAQAASNAEGNYRNGVTAAAQAGRFGKGIQKAGDAKWKKNATEKGPARFAQGVAVAEMDYSSAIAPFLEVIGRTDLPARGPVGSDSNYQRSAAIGKALRMAKVGR